MTRGDGALTERSPPTVLYELPINVPQFAFNAGGRSRSLLLGPRSGFWTIWGTYNDDGVELGLHVQTGAEFKLNNQIALIGELKWSVSETHDVELGGISANAGVKLNF